MGSELFKILVACGMIPVPLKAFIIAFSLVLAAWMNSYQQTRRKIAQGIAHIIATSCEDLRQQRCNMQLATENILRDGRRYLEFLQITERLSARDIGSEKAAWVSGIAEYIQSDKQPNAEVIRWLKAEIKDYQPTSMWKKFVHIVKRYVAAAFLVFVAIIICCYPDEDWLTLVLATVILAMGVFSLTCILYTLGIEMLEKMSKIFH